jgi:hypothetical protein
MSTISQLAELYAVPGTAFAQHAQAIEKSLERAVAVRTQAAPPPGQWHGQMLPRRNGNMNFDPRKPRLSRRSTSFFIGSMGGIRRVFFIGGMGG